MSRPKYLMAFLYLILTPLPHSVNFEQRACFHCIGSVEDELHFLIDCPLYDDMRCKMVHKAQLCNKDVILYDSTEKRYFY